MHHSHRSPILPLSNEQALSVSIALDIMADSGGVLSVSFNTPRGVIDVSESDSGRIKVAVRGTDGTTYEDGDAFNTAYGIQPDDAAPDYLLAPSTEAQQ